MVFRCFCMSSLLCTVPACAVTGAWHPAVSGTGSSSSSAGWSQTSAPSPPAKHKVIAGLIQPLDPRMRKTGENRFKWPLTDVCKWLTEGKCEQSLLPEQPYVDRRVLLSFSVKQCLSSVTCPTAHWGLVKAAVSLPEPAAALSLSGLSASVTAAKNHWELCAAPPEPPAHTYTHTREVKWHTHSSVRTVNKTLAWLWYD